MHNLRFRLSCRPSSLAALLILAGLTASAASAAAPTAVDVLSVARVSGVRTSPDGKRATYLLSKNTFDPKAKPSDDDDNGGWSAETQLWLVDLVTGARRRLTTGDHQPSPGVWSPEREEIAFARGDGKRVWLNVMPLDGGEPERVETGKLKPSDVRWAPDGESLHFVATTPRTDDERAAKWRSGGTIHWDREWRNSRVWHVARAGGEPRAVTPPELHVVEWEISPDGKRLGLLVSSSADPYVALKSNAVVVDVASAAVVAELDAPPRPTHDLCWSPDGRTLAMLRDERGFSFPSTVRLWEPDAKRWHDAAGTAEMTLLGLAFSPDGKSLVAHEAHRTESRLWRIPRSGGGAPADLGFRGRVVHEGGGLRPVLGGKQWLVTSSTIDSAPSPTIFDPKSRRVRVVFDPAPELAGWSPITQEVVRWRSPEGTELEGLFARPAGVATPPLVVFPHGGPDAVTDQGFSAFTRYFVGRGYAVFRPNYRGGTAYGFAFYAANRGRFGDIELMDIESGVDALIAAGKVDAERLYYGGWSWGGYISAWTLTHATRYLAHVVGAAIIDTTVQFVTSDINHGEVAHWEFQGDPWRNPEAFDRPSPIRHVRNAKAPTLIMHGLADDRVGFVNSQILYRALADLDVPVTFYAYPDEPHGIGKPARFAHMLENWASWYEAHPPK